MIQINANNIQEAEKIFKSSVLGRILNAREIRNACLES